MILHVLAPGPVGGLESVVRLLAAGQRGRGHAVGAALVLDPGAENHPLVAPLEAAGVRVERLVIPFRAYREERRALARLFAHLRPRIVHTHGYRADVLAGGVARRAGRPVVTTVHGFTGGGWKNRVYEWLQRRAYRRYDAVIAVSHPLAARLAADGVPAERIHTIPNAYVSPVEPLPRAAARRELGPADGGAPVLGWVGRLSQEKGADLFLRALGALRDRPWRASIIGSGRERAALEQLAAELGIAERVTWHGVLPEAGRLFTAFDVFVLSSRTEGTPISLFEAMAAHVPIVAARVGGVPDVVGEAEALLVPPLDTAALAEAVGRVLDAPHQAAVRTVAARERLGAEFALAPWLDRHDRLYDLLTATPRP